MNITTLLHFVSNGLPGTTSVSKIITAGASSPLSKTGDFSIFLTVILGLLFITALFIFAYLNIYKNAKSPKEIFDKFKTLSKFKYLPFACILAASTIIVASNAYADDINLYPSAPEDINAYVASDGSVSVDSYYIDKNEYPYYIKNIKLNNLASLKSGTWTLAINDKEIFKGSLDVASVELDDMLIQENSKVKVQLSCSLDKKTTSALVGKEVISAELNLELANKCNVDFDMQGHGQAIDRQNITWGNCIAMPQDPVEDAWIFEGWYDEKDNLWNFENRVPMQDNFVLYAKWSEEKPAPEPIPEKNICHVDFDMQGHGSSVQPQDIEWGEKIIEPESPSEQGWIFNAWYTENGTKWDFNNTVPSQDNFILLANWSEDEPEPVPEKKTCHVDFDMQGHGTDVSSQDVLWGNKIVQPDVSQVEGFTFAGWTDSNGNIWNFDDPVPELESFTLLAKWDAIMCTATIDFGDGAYTSCPQGWEELETSKVFVRQFDYNSEYSLVLKGWEYGNIQCPDGKYFTGFFPADNSIEKITEDLSLRATYNVNSSALPIWLGPLEVTDTPAPVLSDGALEILQAGFDEGDYISFSAHSTSDEWYLNITDGNSDNVFSYFSGNNENYNLAENNNIIKIQVSKEKFQKLINQKGYGGTFSFDGKNIVIDGIDIIKANKYSVVFDFGEGKPASCPENWQQIDGGNSYSKYFVENTPYADIIDEWKDIVVDSPADTEFNGFSPSEGFVTDITNFSANYTVLQKETVLAEGEWIADNWANQPYLLDDGGKQFIDANVKAGDVVNFYVESLDPAWKVEIYEGHWGLAYCSYCSIGNDTENGKFQEIDLEQVGGKLSLILTQEMIDAALTQQWWGGIFLLNGDKIKCTKITVTSNPVTFTNKNSNNDNLQSVFNAILCLFNVF